MSQPGLTLYCFTAFVFGHSSNICSFRTSLTSCCFFFFYLSCLFFLQCSLYFYVLLIFPLMNSSPSGQKLTFQGDQILETEQFVEFEVFLSFLSNLKYLFCSNIKKMLHTWFRTSSPWESLVLQRTGTSLFFLTFSEIWEQNRWRAGKVALFNHLLSLCGFCGSPLSQWGDSALIQTNYKWKLLWADTENTEVLWCVCAARKWKVYYL